MNIINGNKSKLVSSIVKGITIILIIYIQIKVCEFLWYGLTHNVKYFLFGLEILKILFIGHIIYKLQNPSYKLLWVISIAIVPIPAMLLYIIFGNPKIRKSFQQKINNEYKESRKYVSYDDRIYDEIKTLDKLKYNQAEYIYRTTGLSVYNNPDIEYFQIGEKYFESLLNDISKAKKHIFIECYSIYEGVMWNKLLDAIKIKSKEGIETRIITDGLVKSDRFPKDFKKNLDNNEIKFTIFNPVNINFNSYLNYRDHRKMIIIDNDIVYTGGLNIGDEYINVNPKYGHWKDAGIKILGNSTLSYILMFIEMWNLTNGKDKLDYKNYIIDNNKKGKIGDGYILPYCDGPDNSSNPAQNLYIQMINSAKSYVYITTPYLVLDNGLVTALVNSAKSGVDIRIITPYISDKPYVQKVSRAFYQILLEAGVKIYEYKPGFIHSKTFVIDDELAAVGTVNLDFRGLYFHYECGNWLYKTSVEKQIKDDFINTKKQSIEIELDIWQKRSVIKKMCDKILITFSPLI